MLKYLSFTCLLVYSFAEASTYEEAGNAVKDALIEKYEIKKYVDNVGRFLLQQVGDADKPILWTASGYRVYRDRRVVLKWDDKTLEIDPNKIKLEYTTHFNWR